MYSEAPIDIVLGTPAFREVIKDGSGWKACCPAHEDRTPSLSINVGDDGRVLLHCHAGCQLDEILTVTGLAPHDLFPRQPRKHTPKPEHQPKEYPNPTLAMASYAAKLGKPATQYDYYDESGEIVLIVGRFNQPDGSKEFRPVSLGTNGKWYCRAPDKRPLYNLPNVRRAVAAGKPVHVVEGEKAADAADSIGLTATTSMNGSKSPSKTDWSPLAGATVIIFPDNDAAGRDYAKTVKTLCEKLEPPANVKVVLLPLQEAGDDIVEWIEAHGEAAEPESMREELEKLAEDASIEASDISTPSPFKIVSAGELVRDYPELREPIIDGILRKGETMNIVAAPKTGKSWLSMGLALTVAAGWVWLGRFRTTPNTVLLVDNELHEETIAFRLRWLANRMQIDPSIWHDRIHIVSARGRGLDLPAVAAQLSTKTYGLTILDAWYRFQPVGSNENSNSDVTALYNILDGLKDTAKCCIHHTSKGDQSGKAVHEVGAGAGAQSRAPDAHVTLRPHEEPNAIVVDAAVRSFPPMESFCLRLEHPLWVYDANLDPSKLKTSKPPKQAPAEKEQDKATKQQEALDRGRDKVLKVYARYPHGETKSAIRDGAGMSGKEFGPINESLLDSGHIVSCTVKKGPGSYPGFKLVGQVGQVGQVGLSESSGMVGQLSSSLEDSVVQPISTVA